MFNENLFRFLLKEKNLTISDVAKYLDISIVTLYRKMSGESDFYSKEIQKCCELLDEKNMNAIFFATKVS